MYELPDFKKGLRVMVEGSPFQIVDFQHVKPGKGNQFTRTKLRNLLTYSCLKELLNLVRDLAFLMYKILI